MIVKTMSWKGPSVYNQPNIQTILRVDIHSRKTLFILGRKTESGNINYKCEPTGTGKFKQILGFLTIMSISGCCINFLKVG